MAKKRVARGTGFATKAKDSAANGLFSLPNELLDEALEYLPQDDLRRVASVSRALHGAAWRAGLYIFRRIHWMNFTRNKDVTLARLNDLIDHALQNDLALWLAIWMSFDANGPPGVQEWAVKMAAALTRSLPRLVGLSLRVDADLLPLIYPVLSNPTPILRNFMHTMPRLSSRQGPFPTLPMDLFSGGAPHLRAVALPGYMIGSSPVPAFARVHTLIIEDFTVVPPTPIKLCFPSVSILHVRAELQATDLTPLDFSGLQLRRLVCNGHDPWVRIYELRNLELDAIAEIHLVQFFPMWTGRLWERDIGEFAVALRADDESSSDPGWQVAVIPAHRPWRFVYHIIDDEKPLRHNGLDKIPGAAQLLTSVRLDNFCIHGFLDREGGAFPALRELRIDLHSASKAQGMLWPPDRPELFSSSTMPANARSAPTFDGSPKSPYSVPCPALTTLTVFALDKPMIVQAPAAAFLGRALGCLERAKSARPVLSLVGVDFAPPARAHALVNSVFSAVHKRAFVGGVSEDYADISRTAFELVLSQPVLWVLERNKNRLVS